MISVHIFIFEYTPMLCPSESLIYNNIWMGAMCEKCLKHQIRKDDNIMIDLTEGQRLNFNQKLSDKQVLYSGMLLNI